MISQNLTPRDDDRPSAAEVDAELQKIKACSSRIHIAYLDYRGKMEEKPDLGNSNSYRARMARLLAKGN